MKKNKLFSGRGLSARTRASYEMRTQRAYLKDRISSLKKHGLLKFSSLKDINLSSFKAKGTIEEIQAQTEQIKKLLASPLSSTFDVLLKRGKLGPRRPAPPVSPPTPEPVPEPPRRPRPPAPEPEPDDNEDYGDGGYGDGGYGDGVGAGIDVGPDFEPEAPTTGPGAHDRYSDIMDMIPEDERDEIREEYDSQDVFWLGDTMYDQDMSIDEARDAFDRQRERRLEELEPERSPEPF